MRKSARVERLDEVQPVLEWAMSAMTPEQARAFFERWKLVREVEAAELRRTSMDSKLRQLAALMESRAAFGPDPQRESETEAVRERWMRIRQALRA